MTVSGRSSTLDLLPGINFALVDVFADRPLTGNPLAVVADADHLTDDQLRAVAREFNQSETTFLFAPTCPGADQRLRSFTAAGHEVGGAGHNALGAWLWLAHTGRFAAGSHRQEIAGDVLDVEITQDGGGRFSVVMNQAEPLFLASLEDRSPLAESLGLHRDDLDDTLPPQVVSTGAGHLLVAVVDRESVDRVTVDASRLREILASVGGEGAYVYTTASPAGEQADAYARFFNPTMGIVEDPATGTAAGPLAALLAEHGRVADESAVVIDQGNAIGRPSRLRVSVVGGTVRLSGSGLTVGEGRLAVGGAR